MKPDKKLCGKWAVIKQYFGSNPNPDTDFNLMLVKFFDRNPERFYIKNTRSWAMILDGTKLMKVYDGEYRTAKEYSKLYVNFMKEYYPVSPNSELVQSNGWISPDGEYYTCAYGKHIPMAERLLAVIYGEDEQYPELHEKGWARIYPDGDVLISLEFISEKLRDKLVALSSIGNDEWKDGIKNFLSETKVR